jgi:hypothetical protein
LKVAQFLRQKLEKHRNWYLEERLHIFDDGFIG